MPCQLRRPDRAQPRSVIAAHAHACALRTAVLRAADLYTKTIEPREYVQFLRDLLAELKAKGRLGQPRKRPQDEIDESFRRRLAKANEEDEARNRRQRRRAKSMEDMFEMGFAPAPAPTREAKKAGGAQAAEAGNLRPGASSAGPLRLPTLDSAADERPKTAASRLPVPATGELVHPGILLERRAMAERMRADPTSSLDRLNGMLNGGKSWSEHQAALAAMRAQRRSSEPSIQRPHSALLSVAGSQTRAQTEITILARRTHYPAETPHRRAFGSRSLDDLRARPATAQQAEVRTSQLTLQTQSGIERLQSGAGRAGAGISYSTMMSPHPVPALTAVQRARETTYRTRDILALRTEAKQFTYVDNPRRPWENDPLYPLAGGPRVALGMPAADQVGTAPGGSRTRRRDKLQVPR